MVADFSGQKPLITRVGGRSKTPALDEFSLMRQRNVAAKFRQFDPSYARMKREAHEAVRRLENDRANLMTELFALNNLEGIVDLSSLTCSEELMKELPLTILDAFLNAEWFGLGSDFERDKMSDIERLKRWFNVRNVQVAQPFVPPPQAAKKVVEIDQDSDSDEDYDLDELQEHRLIVDIYYEAERAENRAPQNVIIKYLYNEVKRNVQHRLASVQSQQSSLKQSKNLPINTKNDTLQGLNTEIQKQKHELNMINKKESFIQLVLRSYKDKSILSTEMEILAKISDVYFRQQNSYVMLSRAQKWTIFFYCLERAKMLTAIEVKKINDELFNAQKQLQEVFRYGDGQIIKKAKIVGMTTTGRIF